MKKYKKEIIDRKKMTKSKTKKKIKKYFNF